VNNAGMSGSRRYFTKVIDKDGANTLLFTNSQIIGIMLGPDDLQHLHGSSSLKAAANQTIKGWQGYREVGIAKGVQFASLNANHWGEMADALCAQPLEAVLGNHLNFGLPYDRIRSVEVKSRFINPGLVFHLTNGSHLRFGSFGKKDRLPHAADCLRQFVKVQ
jgi:hypothetical protein